MAKKASAKKKTVPAAEPPLNPADDTSDLPRRFGEFGQRVHELLSKLPESLNILRKDAVQMHFTIDENSRLRSISYWLFIVASCGIAILGLIINSPAVIIGAMLVSPLMAPIIGLGMSIAINDVYLGIKSAIALVFSVLGAVLTAALITLIVPLREVTPEILGRTNPTVLDLFIALFCGLVASLSSVRSNGNAVMRDVAPGAAIGVALMPPLCVVGYGLGIGFNWDMMWGAFLLFVTNLMAIVLVSSLIYYFIYEGYRPDRLIQRLANKRKKEEPLYTSKLSLFWLASEAESGSRRRLLFPAVLVLIIIIPLTVSFQFLKKKNDVRNLITSRLEEKKVQFLRGPEALTYTREGVVGNIIYSSAKVVDLRFAEDLKKEIKARFGGYDARINLIRVAGQSDIADLKRQREITLENTRDTLHDREKHAYAVKLVQRALALVHPRIPESVGLCIGVRITYSVQGMDTVVVDYVGNRPIRGQALRLVEDMLRSELRQLKGDVRAVRLNYVGRARGNLFCARREADERSRNRVDQFISVFSSNPYIKMNLELSPELAEHAGKGRDLKKLKALTITSREKPRCLIRYQYERL